MIYVSMYLAVGMLWWLTCIIRDGQARQKDPLTIVLGAGLLLAIAWPLLLVYVAYKDSKHGRK
jgi:hypothetical protein